MASLALGIVGSYFGGPVGGFVGAALGAYVDNAYLYPALFPQDTPKGPRQGDLRFQSGAEGSPMNLVLGPFNLTTGTVIWLGDRIEVSRKKKVAKNTKVKVYEYYQDIAIAFCDTRDIPVSRIRQIWANDELIYDNAPGTQYESIALYYGDQTSPDPTILAKEGSDVPAHKHLCFIVLKRYFLEQGSIPIFRARIAQDENMSVGKAIETLATREDRMDITELDTSQLTTCFNGYTVSGAQSGADLLAPIITAYTLGVQQKGSKVYFFPRGQEVEVNITPEDMSFSSGIDGTDNPVPFELEDTSDRDIPPRTMVKFLNPDKDLETGAEPYEREDARGSGTITFDSNLTLYRDEAQKLARQLTWAAAVERQPIRCTLPPKFVFLLDGNALVFTYQGREYRVYCTSVTQGANYIVEVQGVLSPKSLYVQKGEGTDADSSGGIYAPTETVGHVLDIPALTDDEVEAPTVYAAACAKNVNAVWQGAIFEQSITAGVFYDDKGSLGTEGQIGYTIAPLAKGPTAYWDMGNTLDITLYEENSLETVTRTECLNGSNRIAVRAGSTGEWEVIGFTTVTQLSANTFRLSELLRGLRGTEHLVDVHAASGEPAVVLQDDGSIISLELTRGLLGVSLHYKFPMVGGVLTDYPSQRVTSKGISCRPLSPVFIKGEWDPTTQDATISWTRRGKYLGDILGPAGSPLAPDEVPEKYDIDLRIGGPDSPILRSYTTGSTSIVYTAADQSADGLSPGFSAVHVTVYQLSNIVGRGQPGREVIKP